MTSRLLFFITCSLVILLSTAFSEKTSFADVQKIQSKTDSCITSECHTSIQENKFVHGPVKAGVCTVCHGELPKHEKRPKWNAFKKIENLSKICYSCHDTFQQKKFTHTPVGQEECTACHDPHSSSFKFQLLAKGSDLCFTCHDKALVSDKYVHGPAAAGGCAVCHDPHTADYKYNLRAEGSSLCFMCHTEKAASFENAEFTHKPAIQNCISCHNPHSSPLNFMLSADSPDLCFNCHKDKKKYLESVPNKHDAVTTDRSCLNCHDPHMSNIAKNLIMPPLDLCMNCHNKTVEASDGQILSNMEDLLSKNKDHHGPIRQKDCSGCHDPHGSTSFRLLRNPYPSTFYKSFSPDDYKLCFSCHEKEIVENPRTSKLTNFRNGDINLHYKHVNKPDKGRTCRACHETHASKYPKHIREGVPFGKWELPLNFIKTDTGGSCTPGCHKIKKYNRVRPEQP